MLGNKGKGKKGKAKEDKVFDVERHLNQMVYVKFTGGREIKGLLKGIDEVTNLVLDD